MVANSCKLTSYFTKLYTCKDKGTLANRMNVIRRFIFKITKLDHISSAQLKSDEPKINN